MTLPSASEVGRRSVQLLRIASELDRIARCPGIEILIPGFREVMYEQADVLRGGSQELSEMARCMRGGPLPAEGRSPSRSRSPVHGRNTRRRQS